MPDAGKDRKTGETVEVHVRIQSPRMAKLVSGEISVEDLDDEELARGMCRDKSGGFRGRPTKMVPRVIHERMQAELIKRGNLQFQEAFSGAIKAMADIAKDKKAKDADRIKAAQYVIERIAGKVPDKVEVHAADPWQTIIDEILIDSSTPAKPKAARSRKVPAAATPQTEE